ncbi:MAG: hypothetical protein ACREKS_10345 [Candidatus Rokuibacteriota bacterium]
MTKRILWLVALGALLLGSAATADAGGRRGPGWGRPGVGVGVYYGPRFWGPRPWWGPGWYGFRPWPLYPYYGGYYYPYGAYAPYPAPVIVQQDPQVYIQQTPSAQAAPAPSDPGQPQPSQYWYYCEDERGYYPYVQQCPRGWMTVVPPASPR